MNHHARSFIAIVFALGFLVISWLVGHRPADWEYVFLMFFVFSSAMQDAMDSVNHRLEKVTRLIEESAAKAEDLSREVRQEAEYLKSHVTAEANLVTYELRLLAALQRGEAAPEAPPCPEAEFVEPEPPKLEPFDARKFRAERLREMAEALREYSWWDMTVLTSPLRRLLAYIAGRPAFIRWFTSE